MVGWTLSIVNAPGRAAAGFLLLWQVPLDCAPVILPIRAASTRRFVAPSTAHFPQSRLPESAAHKIPSEESPCSPPS